MKVREEEKTAGIVQTGWATGEEWPEHDSKDRIAKTGQLGWNNCGS
jgi:hypothetical protein